jgi:hypothetical protein
VDPLTLYGTPKVLDPFLRPPARFVHLVFGGFASAAFFWLGYPLIAPLPFALGFVWYEWFFWSRGDRACRVDFHPDGRIVVFEPLQDRTWDTDLATITSATLVYRSTDDERHDCVAVLGSSEGIRLALQFRLNDFVPHDSDVDADRWDAIFGGVSGLIRTLAPAERLMRQSIEDGRGLAWLRATLPADAWETTAVRVWRGRTPALDLFGYHSEAPSGLLMVTGDQVSLWDGQDTETHPRGATTVTQSHRPITLFRMWGEDSEETEQDVPLLLLEIGPHTVAIPAPAAAPVDTPLEPREDWLHMHAPEGASLVSHLLRHTGRDDWPAAFREAFVEPNA